VSLAVVDGVIVTVAVAVTTDVLVAVAEDVASGIVSVNVGVASEIVNVGVASEIVSVGVGVAVDAPVAVAVAV